MTAEDFLFDTQFKGGLDDRERDIAIKGHIISHDQYINAMIDFAKTHVEAALEAASESLERLDYLDIKIIIESYPLSNIK